MSAVVTPLAAYPAHGEHADPTRSVTALSAKYGGLDDQSLLAVMIEKVFPGEIAAVSSFGAEAIVLLDLIAEIDAGVPVVFLETGKMFPETLDYVATVRDRLGLTDLRMVRPDSAALRSADRDGMLWRTDPDACCYLRKVKPLEDALAGFAAWITGRKRFHGGDRSDLPRIELVDGQIKINPLANWSHDDLQARMAERGLPEHPLVAKGYPSIGCAPCTALPGDGGSVRDGRWAGTDKTECGIHKAKWHRETPKLPQT